MKLEPLSLTQPISTKAFIDIEEKGMHTTGGLAIWRGDEYILNFLFAIRLQFQPTDNAEQ